MAWVYSALEHLCSACCVRGFCHQRHRRNQSFTLRPGGIRTGTGRRLAYGIQLDEVPDVHDGGVCQHDRRCIDGNRSVSRRMERPRVWACAAGDGAAYCLVRVEGFGPDLLLLSLAIHDSKVSLRSADEVRLEGFAPTGAGKRPRDQLDCGYFMIEILFFFFAAVAIGAAINVLVQKHVLYSALSLILMLTAVSVLFVFLGADFIAVIQVIVYAGAIMVLFTFVIMLLNLPADEDGADRLRWLKFIGIPVGLFLLFLIVATLWNVEPLRADTTRLTGSPQAIGHSLFIDYLLPFELTSLLILIALVGAVVFAKKDL